MANAGVIIHSSNWAMANIGQDPDALLPALPCRVSFRLTRVELMWHGCHIAFQFHQTHTYTYATLYLYLYFLV